MSGRMLLGVVLIALGVIALVYQGFTYTTQKKVLDIGPIQATKEEHHSIPVPPIIGGTGTEWCSSLVAWIGPMSSTFF